MHLKYSLGFIGSNTLHTGSGSLDQLTKKCLEIIGQVIIIGCEMACVNSESDENGASLNSTWHDRMLDGDFNFKASLFP